MDVLYNSGKIKYDLPIKNQPTLLYSPIFFIMENCQNICVFFFKIYFNVQSRDDFGWLCYRYEYCT